MHLGSPVVAALDRSPNIFLLTFHCLLCDYGLSGRHGPLAFEAEAASHRRQSHFFGDTCRSPIDYLRTHLHPLNTTGRDLSIAVWRCREPHRPHRKRTTSPDYPESLVVHPRQTSRWLALSNVAGVASKNTLATPRRRGKSLRDARNPPRAGAPRIPPFASSACSPGLRS